MNRALTVFLALSLAANVFLGGFVAGRVFGGPAHGHMRGHGPGFERGGPGGQRGEVRPLFGAMEDLSPAGREVMHETFKGERERMRAGFGKALELRRALGDALAAEPFDRAKAEAALAAIEAADGRTHHAVSTLVIDAAEKMTPADRKALAQTYQKPRERWRHSGDGGPGPPPGDRPGEDPDGGAPDRPPPE